ncbi:stage II sporulation protein P [Acetohalobium arabaticum]|uniref:Stage II sporulation protein P n=1 Tax=Acetohalobium arabaticum (strain ATCC 49924 / DSM 5501 / Z-7288) TaxID=574087 RepID=D9QPX4_ACEAZ|nr:stage II sporulation protein P [Acetohalobium arabaticum]ADL12565.1 stage II sporulation protein P [Acetohalobium arabaticum DSM 5501]
MSRYSTKVSVLVLTFLLLFSTLALAAEESPDYFTVVDQKGNTVFKTEMKVHKGDWYIGPDNKKYTVVEVKEDKAVAEYDREVDLISEDSKLPSALSELSTSEAPLAKGKDKKTVALYHTHSSESFVPTSGTHSEKGLGDIHNVVNKLATELEQKGVKVINAGESNGPHDGGAYARSRRTAKKLAQKSPDAIFDVHRDGVPDKSQYLTKVNGKQVAKVRLVVGRQNPGMKANDKFAKQLKYVTDKKYPGLVKGIYYAKGSYNQDLSPRATLLEFGTHTITEDDAKESTVFFSNAVTSLISAQAQGAENVTNEQNSGAFRSLLIILGVVIIGMLGYLFANEGSLNGVINRIKEFFGREFAGISDGNDEE